MRSANVYGIGKDCARAWTMMDIGYAAAVGVQNKIAIHQFPGLSPVFLAFNSHTASIVLRADAGGKNLKFMLVATLRLKCHLGLDFAVPRCCPSRCRLHSRKFLCLPRFPGRQPIPLSAVGNLHPQPVSDFPLHRIDPKLQISIHQRGQIAERASG